MVLPLATTPDSNGRVAGATALSAGVYLVTLRATDPDATVGTDSVLVTVNPDDSGNQLPTAPVVAIRPAQLGYMLEGIDWRHPQRTWRPRLAG